LDLGQLRLKENQINTVSSQEFSTDEAIRQKGRWGSYPS